ncbi:MAG: hypothetical protein RMM17_08850 [Acidobacteriota bacterium]|nr:hypothetical protein [Blastocatellia bacterium]MDW8412774.1 hypothetical protein [Acidobacteriota bacterium]
MFSFLSNFKHKQEMRESKDEIMIGELVLAMHHLGAPTIRLYADSGQQYISFKLVSDPILNSVTIILDRKTGGSALGEMLVGNKAVLTVQAEVKNYVADPDDLLQMYRTDLQNIFRVPLLGDIRLDHQLNSVMATKKLIIDIDQFIFSHENRLRLHRLLTNTLAELREALRKYKKTN